MFQRIPSSQQQDQSVFSAMTCLCGWHNSVEILDKIHLQYCHHIKSQTAANIAFLISSFNSARLHCSTCTTHSRQQGAPRAVVASSRYSVLRWYDVRGLWICQLHQQFSIGTVRKAAFDFLQVFCHKGCRHVASLSLIVRPSRTSWNHRHVMKRLFDLELVISRKSYREF